jgi:hypothetical protein
VSDGGAGGTSLIATNGMIGETGTLVAGTLTGRSTGTTSLTGATTTTNAIASVGSFTSTAFTLNDGTALTVAGPVNAGSSATIFDAQALTVNGSLSSSSVIGLTGSLIAITNAASVSDGGAGNTSLVATNGPITETGTLIAGTLTGSATGATNLTGATAGTNQIANLSNFGATTLTLNDGASLTVIGPVKASSGSVAITGQGALTNNSTIQAGSNATLLAATSITNTGSVIAQAGNATLTASTGTLANAGLIQASTNATLLGQAGLTNTGSVIAQAGNATLTATTGTLFNSGLISAAAADAVVALNAKNGQIIQSGSAGSIIAGGSVAIDALGGITLNGLVKDDIGVSLVSGGTIYQNGTLIAELLSGSAVGSVELYGVPSVSSPGNTPDTNQVANLGTFTVTGSGSSFALSDGANLLISGVVSAATITIHDGSNTISLGNGGFFTDGAVRPTGALLADLLPPNGTTTLGAYLYGGSVLQTGSSFTVNNLPDGTQESVLAITLVPSGGGTLQFNSGGLVAPNTWLVVNVGNGQAGGIIDVKALDFNYSPPPSRADFTGTIDGNSGQTAAGVAFIEPQPNSNFRMNGCPIHSVNCVLLTTQGVPTTNPANDINVGAPPATQNPEDLVLPVVSDERYELTLCADPNGDGACKADVPSAKK